MALFNNPLPARVQEFISAAIFIAALIGLYFTSRINYLLFHSLAEIFSIVVASALFMIAWNSRQYIKNPYLLFIGIAYLFIGSIDLLHTLTYKGMPIFTDYDFYANQLWIGARYMESITLLLAFAYLYVGRPIRPYGVLAAYTVATGLLIASVLYWKIFPECFVAGTGLTPFKKISEYVICLILVINILLLTKSRQRFELKIFRLLLWSIACTIISELAFTFYVSNYGFSNLVGHYFKIFSFCFVYPAIIKTGIEKPYDLIFRDLDHTNKQLAEEITIRKESERERESLITELQKAIDEIQTLRGILPLCSFCKKIRNDNGEWENVDTYIHKHSEADVSHGVCPDCIKKHYPEFDMID
jgi:hypothetical protein